MTQKHAKTRAKRYAPRQRAVTERSERRDICLCCRYRYTAPHSEYCTECEMHPARWCN